MKAKPLLLILATLIIGFVLGMLTSAQIRNHKLNPVRVFFSEERFREGFYRAIQPDGEQKVKIDIVLDKYARLNSELQGTYRKELDSVMKEFHREIDAYLTKDQIVRLREMDERRQQMIQHNRLGHKKDTSRYGGDYHHFHQGRSMSESDTVTAPRNASDSTGSINKK
jgi:hypothetical protein